MPLAEKILFLHTKGGNMKRKTIYVVLVLSLFLLLASCASNRPSRAMRKAERQMEQQEKRSKKQYEKAKSAHFKHQAKKTKRMIKQDQRRAEKMRRHQRSNPYYWFYEWQKNLIYINVSISKCWIVFWKKRQEKNDENEFFSCVLSKKVVILTTFNALNEV